MYYFNSLPYTPLRITSGWGYRDTGIPGATKWHPAVDMGTDRTKPHTTKNGGPIRAVMPGVVHESKWNSARGWVIILYHGTKDGKSIKTLYQHMMEQGLKVGTKVEAGDIIGTMGNTGVGAQLHLHFELHENDKPVDPTWHLMNIRKEEEIVKVEKIKVIINGNLTEVESILVNGFHYMKVRDLADADKTDDFTVAWDDVKKIVVIKSR